MKDYPSLLPHLKRSALPEEVQRRLLALRDALGKGRIRGNAVRAAVDALSDLQAETCLTAAREIGGLALPYYTVRTWFRRAGPLDYRRLLSRHPALAHIYLFHWDGHMREAALRAPNAPRLTPFWVAAIVIRLNDWVPQVRQAAVDCLIKVLPKTDVEVLVDVARDLLHRRRQWTRGEEELAVLDKLISAPGVLNGLIAHLTVTYDRTPHRTLIAILKYPELDPALPGLMTAAPNPAVRAIAAHTLLADQARWPVGAQYEWIDKSMGRRRQVLRFESRPIACAISKDELIAVAAADRSVQVRKVAMQALIDAPDLWPDRQVLIDTMAKDRSGAIRAGIDYIHRQQAKSR
jgi:hypothetical protein